MYNVIYNVNMSLRMMTKQALSVSFKSLKFNRSKFSYPSITKRQLGQGHGLLYGGPERLYFGSTRYKPRGLYPTDKRPNSIYQQFLYSYRMCWESN